MKTGIYQIRNSINDKRYIGSCASVKGFSTRWSKHHKQLEKQQHHSPILQNAWNKHGVNAFIFEILLYCDPKDCLVFEQIALDCYQPEYNICKLAGSCLGVKRSIKTKILMSKITSGENNPMYGKTHSKNTKQRIGYSSSQRHKGSQNPFSKLTESHIDIIKTRLNSGETQRSIALDLDVCQSTISRVKTGKIWRHI